MRTVEDPRPERKRAESLKGHRDGGWREVLEKGLKKLRRDYAQALRLHHRALEVESE